MAEHYSRIVPAVAAEGLAFGVKASEQSSLPEHIIELSQGQWGLWKTFGLRGAGFPAETVLRLSSGECACAADRVLEAEISVETIRGETLRMIQQRLQEPAAENREALVKALRLLKKGKVTEAIPDSSVEETFARFRDATFRLNEARSQFQHAFADSLKQASEVIRDVASSSGFREAVIWQNRQAFHTGVNVLLQKTPGDSYRRSKQKKHEELVASYLQRYCVKNDTIGFFGPVGWGKFVSQGESFSASPGASLLTARNVYFEQWAIDTLGMALAQNKDIEPSLAPRCMPFVRIEGNVLYLPANQSVRIPSLHAALLKACDGKKTARDIARSLLNNGMQGLTSAQEIYSHLRHLAIKGLITWTLELAIEPDPVVTIKNQLNKVADERTRMQALDAVDELDKARLAIAAAAGEPEKLDRALSEMEATFTRLTGSSSTRSAGQTYAGRTLVYEDCRRDVELEIGPDVLKALGDPLALLLAGARWISYKTAEAYRDVFKNVYRSLARKRESSVISGIDFWLQAQPLVFDGETTGIVEKIEAEFSRIWAGILRLPAGERRVTYKTEELRSQVLSAFDAPGPGWQLAGYHSPDVMIIASGSEAINRGDYQLVTGELHVGINTLTSWCRVAQHPNPEEIRRAVDSDFARPRLVAVAPRSWPNAALRTRTTLVSSKDVRVSLTQDSVPGPTINAIPIAEFVVEETDGHLFVRTRDNTIRFEAIEAFGEILSGRVINSLLIIQPALHTPRVSFDRLIVAREAWRFTASQMSFATEKDESERFIAARRWARSHGIPRFVFAKVPVEAKPFYADFNSPVYVNILSKMVRRTMEGAPADDLITVSEMLPGIDETWLPDAEGKHYTSELRIVAVDLKK